MKLLGSPQNVSIDCRVHYLIQHSTRIQFAISQKVTILVKFVETTMPSHHSRICTRSCLRRHPKYRHNRPLGPIVQKTD